MKVSRGFKKPFLLCVGAQKSGTTWLSSILDKETRVWVPALKEMHYFDRYSTIQAVRERGDGRYHERFRNLVADLEKMRRITRKRHIGLLDRCLIDSDEDYADFYRRYAAKAPAAADLTPEYALLPCEGLERIRAVLPNVFVLFLMRDPVDRLWSAAKHRVRFVPKYKHILTDLSAMRRFSSEPVVSEMCNYHGTLSRLNTVFPKVRTAFFEEMLASDAAAHAFLTEVLNDLGVPVPEKIENIRRRVYEGTSAKMPEEWRQVLRKDLDPVYSGLTEMGYKLPAKWTRLEA
ncbi:MAG: sulfotransferase [Roseovarius sp.]